MSDPGFVRLPVRPPVRTAQLSVCALLAALGTGCALLEAFVDVDGDNEADDTAGGGNALTPLEGREPVFVFPEIRLIGPNFVRVDPGEEVSFDWEVIWPDGERPDTVSFSIGSYYPAFESAAEVRGAWVEARSRYRVTLRTARRGAYELALHPDVCVRAQCQAVQAPSAYVRVAGGPAAVVIAPESAVRLGVGEARPFAVYPATAEEPNPYVGNSPFAFRAWSSDPVVFTVDDPAVAVVTDAGEITALEVGETTLRATAGSASVAVALTVDATPLGAPGEGRWPVGNHQIDLLEAPVYGRGVREGKVAVDPNGWPRLAVPVHPGLGAEVEAPFNVDLHPVLLMRWTGTGFGYEALGAPWESHGQPVIAVGSDGHEWMLLRDELFNRLELWDRPAGGPLGAWEQRRLPTGPNLGFGEIVEDGFRGDIAFHDWQETVAAGVWAGADGRVAFAYTTASEITNPYSTVPGFEMCPQMMHLVEVDGAEMEVTQLGLRWLANRDFQQACDAANERGNGRIVLLPPTFGSPHPSILQLGGAWSDASTGGVFATQEGGLWAWRWSPEGWVVEGIGAEETQDLGPILPVEGAQDWFATSMGPVPLWLWKTHDGVLRAEAPPPGLFGDYSGHAVSDAHVYAFTREGDEAFFGQLWMTVWAR